jgi:hypothetical protein
MRDRGRRHNSNQDRLAGLPGIQGAGDPHERESRQVTIETSQEFGGGDQEQDHQATGRDDVDGGALTEGCWPSTRGVGLGEGCP